MSYEPDVHPVQMTILRELLFVNELNFGRLRKATGVESDAFNFHLKQLMEHEYIIKNSSGLYGLTAIGKTYANRMDTEDSTIEKQPKLSVVIMVEDKNGKHLFQERLKQPYYGYWGHPTGKIRWGESMLGAAARELAEETGLEAKLRVAGLYHKLDYDKESRELREDKYFCIIHGINPKGELRDIEGCHNEWLSTEEFLQKEKRFGNTDETNEIIKRSEPTIVEREYYYETEHY